MHVLKVRSPSVRGLKRHRLKHCRILAPYPQSPLPISSGIETCRNGVQTWCSLLLKVRSPSVRGLKPAYKRYTCAALRRLKVRSPSVRGLKHRVVAIVTVLLQNLKVRSPSVRGLKPSQTSALKVFVSHLKVRSPSVRGLKQFWQSCCWSCWSCSQSPLPISSGIETCNVCL